MDPPPSYSQDSASTESSSPADSKQQPPTYTAPISLIAAASLPSASTSSSSTWEPLDPEPNPTLILDGEHIYSSTHPSRPLYILTNPPVDASRSVYGLEKVYYKVNPSTGEVKRARQAHIYDFDMALGLVAIGGVKITGQRASKFTFRKVLLNPSGPGSFKSSGADKGSNIRVSPVLTDVKSKLCWKSEDGKTLATETRGTRDSAKKMVVQPRLEVEGGEGLGERELDLLIVGWCVRVWRESAKDTKEPMTWDKCEYHYAYEKWPKC
ncbi:hypothetical protein CC79DRAFT_1361314 [Sarocladium strictum]